MKKLGIALIAGAVGAVTATVAVAGRYEEPSWTLTERYDGFEIRQYAPTIQARVFLRDDRRGSMNGGFRVLAGYIFGGNAEEQSMSMTIPVTNQPAEGGEIMSFMMPSEYDLDTLPAPLDERVELIEVPGGTFAALRFSGNVDAAVTEEKRRELSRLLSEAGLEPAGEPLVAQYNGPWTPGPFRRNEVLIPLR